MAARLPLFRETERNRRIRVASSDESLGRWLQKRHPETLMTLDAEFDPSTTTLSELWLVYHDLLEWTCSKHGRDRREDECSECMGIVEEIAEWWWALQCATQWLAVRLKEAFDPHCDGTEEFAWHECGQWLPLPGIARAAENIATNELRALRAPTGAGVYYVFACGMVKIGKSSNIARRINALCTPEPPKLIAFEIGDPDALERAAHDRWRALRRHREWFACEGELAAWLAEANSR